MKSTPNVKVLMAVYGVLVCDGRVQRAAQALSETTELTLIGRASKAKCQGLPCKIYDVKLPEYKGFGPIRMLIFWWAFIWKSFRTKPNVVYAHDFQLLFPGWVASCISRAKLIYDAHELIVPEKGRFYSLSHRVYYFIERLLIRYTDLVITANEKRAAIMEAHYKLLKHPTVIRNIPPQQIDLTINISNKQEWLPPLNGKIRLLYQGAMSLVRELDLFIKVLQYLDEQYELIMVGNGTDLEKLKSLAKKENVISRVKFLGQVPAKELTKITKQCTIGIISYSFNNPNQRYCAPNKVYEYAQAGIPMVATDQDILKELVGDTGIGVVLSRGDSIDETLQLYAEGIRDVAEHRDRFISNIPEFIIKNSWESEKNKLIKCSKELLQNGT